MSERIKEIVNAIREAFSSGVGGVRQASQSVLPPVVSGLRGARTGIVAVVLVGGAGYLLVKHPPMQTIGHGEVGIRINHLTGGADKFKEGMVLVMPGLHELRRFSLLDRTYRPERSTKANGEAPFQSMEGLSLGADLTVRYTVDPSRILAMPVQNSADIDSQIVDPAVQGVIYKAFTRYTVREIFSSKRGEIVQRIEAELKPRLAADGIILRSVTLGKIDLPQDYKNGMDKLLAEELEAEKMRFTLELKEKQVKQTELEAQAEKVRQETSAQAAAQVSIIAAKAQEEAMKHVLPFKQKQIEQRQLEAEAEKRARIKNAEGTAEARRIEASGEADSRRKLADAESYRQRELGKVASAQMERDGALVTKHPLLIQKTLADKLSDKISVIIAPPPSNGGFIGDTLLGASAQSRGRETSSAAGQNQNATEEAQQ